MKKKREIQEEIEYYDAIIKQYRKKYGKDYRKIPEIESARNALLWVLTNDKPQLKFTKPKKIK